MKLSIVFHGALNLHWKGYPGWHFVRWGIPTEVNDGVYQLRHHEVVGKIRTEKLNYLNFCHYEKNKTKIHSQF